MSDIDVTHQSVKTAITDLDDVASTLQRADGFVQTYLNADCSGGFFLTNAGGHINTVRERLGHQYRDLGTKVSAASDATLSIWQDFRDEDEAARAKYEKYQEKSDGNDYAFGGNTLIGPDGTIAPSKPPAVTTHPTPSPATSKVDLASLQKYLDNPQADTGWIDTLNTWADFKDGIDKVLAFEWVTGPLQKVGIHVPLDKFKNYMEGNYQEWAESIAAIFALAHYFDQVHTDMDQVQAQIEDRWLGQASTAVQEWLTHFASSADYHRGQLNAFANQIETEAVMCKAVVDQILDLLGDLADLMPVIQINGDGLIDKGLSLLKGAGKAIAGAISALIRIVVKFVAKIELLWTAIWAILTILSQAPNDLEFPEVVKPSVA